MAAAADALPLSPPRALIPEEEDFYPEWVERVAARKGPATAMDIDELLADFDSADSADLREALRLEAELELGTDFSTLGGEEDEPYLFGADGDAVEAGGGDGAAASTRARPANVDPDMFEAMVWRGALKQLGGDYTAMASLPVEIDALWGVMGISLVEKQDELERRLASRGGGLTHGT